MPHQSVQLITESAEESRTCQILILCEDYAAYERAKEICWRILVQFADDLDFSFSCWKFLELEDAECTHAALRTAKNSDIILLSLHNPDLPTQAEAWLDALAGHRVHGDGLLALVLNEPSRHPLAMQALSVRIDGLAKKLGMDFLPLNLLPASGCLAHLPPALATHGSIGEQNYDHWGLNE